MSKRLTPEEATEFDREFDKEERRLQEAIRGVAQGLIQSNYVPDETMERMRKKLPEPTNAVPQRFADYIHEPVCESSGAKAARQAAEHVTELEQELEKARAVRDACWLENHNLRVTVERSEDEVVRLRSERDHYMLQYNAIKQSLSEAATVILNCLQREGVDCGKGS